MSISIPNTQSKLAISNLNDTINTIKSQASFITPAWIDAQVQNFCASLDSYVVAGGDPATLPLATRASETLVNAVAGLLVSDYHMKPFVCEEWYVSTMERIVMDVHAITESLDEGSYGQDLCDRMNAFIVQTEEF